MKVHALGVYTCTCLSPLLCFGLLFSYLWNSINSCSYISPKMYTFISRFSNSKVNFWKEGVGTHSLTLIVRSWDSYVLLKHPSGHQQSLFVPKIGLTKCFWWKAWANFLCCLNVIHTMQNVLYHCLLTSSCARHCVYQITSKFLLWCVSLSTDTIFKEPSPTKFFTTHQMIISPYELSIIKSLFFNQRCTTLHIITVPSVMYMCSETVKI